MKSILKKTTKTPITFEDYFDERIRIMQSSADEYLLFLTRLDDLIARIDSSMENTRIQPKKKRVRFSEQNEVFLIPPREFNLRQTLLTIDFQSDDTDELFSDLFY